MDRWFVDILILGRYKRDDLDDEIVDSAYAECDSDDDCSSVQTCDTAVNICKMTWWMILIIVLLVLIGIGAIIACLLVFNMSYDICDLCLITYDLCQMCFGCLTCLTLLCLE